MSVVCRGCRTPVPWDALLDEEEVATGPNHSPLKIQNGSVVGKWGIFMNLKIAGRYSESEFS